MSASSVHPGVLAGAWPFLPSDALRHEHAALGRVMSAFAKCYGDRHVEVSRVASDALRGMSQPLASDPDLFVLACSVSLALKNAPITAARLGKWLGKHGLGARRPPLRAMGGNTRARKVAPIDVTEPHK